MTTSFPARLSLALSTLAALAPPLAGQPPAPTYTALIVPDAASTQAYGINDKGQVVGSYSDAAGSLHGFGLASGTYYIADIPGASDTEATGISNDEVVGYYDIKSTDAGGNFLTAYHGFVLTENGYATLDVPGADYGTTVINGIDAKNEIVGNYMSNGVTYGFVLKRGVYTTLEQPDGSYTSAGGLNTRGQVVGTYLDSFDSEQGFLLSGGKYVSLFGPGDSFLAYANGINEAGQVVGYSESGPPYTYHGFLLSHGAYTAIAYPGAGAYTLPNGINSSGKIVGSYYAAGVMHGFLYTPAH